MALIQARPIKPKENYTKAKNGNIIFPNELAFKAEMKLRMSKSIQPKIDAEIERNRERLEIEAQKMREEIENGAIKERILRAKHDAAVDVVEVFKPMLKACLYEVFGDLKTLDKRQAQFIKALDLHIDCINHNNTTLEMYKAFEENKDYDIRLLEG